MQYLPTDQKIQYGVSSVKKLHKVFCSVSVVLFSSQVISQESSQLSLLTLPPDLYTDYRVGEYQPPENVVLIKLDRDATEARTKVVGVSNLSPRKQSALDVAIRDKASGVVLNSNTAGESISIATRRSIASYFFLSNVKDTLGGVGAENMVRIIAHDYGLDAPNAREFLGSILEVLAEHDAYILNAQRAMCGDYYQNLASSGTDVALENIRSQYRALDVEALGRFANYLEVIQSDFNEGLVSKVQTVISQIMEGVTVARSNIFDDMTSAQAVTHFDSGCRSIVSK